MSEPAKIVVSIILSIVSFITSFQISSQISKSLLKSKIKGFIEVTEHITGSKALIPIKNISFIGEGDDGRALINLEELSGDFFGFRTLSENLPELTRTFIADETYAEVVKKIKKAVRG